MSSEKAVVDDLWDLLGRAAEAPYLAEPLSQLDHALQCAALAAEAGATDALVIAALLHDVGHLCAPDEAELMGDLGVNAHDRIGAEWLARAGFSDEVAALVHGHVDAKRFLVARSPGYRRKLSPASEATLQWQGGPMSLEEALRFEEHPLAGARLRLRAWDDAAKVPGRSVPSLESWRQLLLDALK